MLPLCLAFVSITTGLEFVMPNTRDNQKVEGHGPHGAGKPVVLVTGGAQGIGRGITAYFLAKGYSVVVADSDREAGEELMGLLSRQGDVRFIRTDVSSEESVQRCIARVQHWFGGLDGLVNNAGIADPYTGPLEYLDLEDWQRIIDVNLTGVFLMVRQALGLLRVRHGAIVNIASTRYLQSEPQTEAYAASKGGVVALTHALAVSLSGQIRVNCISPGWIEVGELQKARSRRPVHLTETCHQQHPVGRVGEAQDVASLVHFLLSDEAGFMTGQNIILDGGMTRKMVYE